MDRRLGRRSKNGLVEKTTYIVVSDLRHALKHEEGRDRQRVRIRSGPAAGLTVSIQWSQLRYGWRPWFLCPACAKPSGRLYTEPAQGWKCRNCLGLHYRSQRGPEAGPRRDTADTSPEAKLSGAAWGSPGAGSARTCRTSPPACTCGPTCDRSRSWSSTSNMSCASCNLGSAGRCQAGLGRLFRPRPRCLTPRPPSPRASGLP